MQRKQGGKIQEVLIQVQRQRDGWMDGCQWRRGIEGGRQGQEQVRLI